MKKKIGLKIMDSIIGWYCVFMYVIVLCVILSFFTSPNVLIEQIKQSLYLKNLLHIKSWLWIIGMYIFGYIIPYNLKENVSNYSIKKRLTFSAIPFTKKPLTI